MVPDSEPLAPPEAARPLPQQASGPSKPSPAYTTPLLKEKAGGKGASGTKAAVNTLPVLYEEKRHDDDSEGEGSPLAAVVAKRPGGRPTVNSKGKGKAKAPAPEILPPTTVSVLLRVSLPYQYLICFAGEGENVSETTFNA